jgi:hypothetical protein
MLMKRAAYWLQKFGSTWGASRLAARCAAATADCDSNDISRER